MSTVLTAQSSQFALDVAEGLLRSGQKQLPPTYLYDDLGSCLFEAITLLPEYGLTRADERLLRSRAPEIALRTGRVGSVAELGSGTGKKTRHILNAIASPSSEFVYSPIDVSRLALDACERELADVAQVRPIQSTWIEGLSLLREKRSAVVPVLLLFLGSSIGNLNREEIPAFLRYVRSCLRKGDFFLLGADLVKPIRQMLLAYDDPTGVTAAFNLNVLGRMNRELHADFNLRLFSHRARWTHEARRIEMHLESQSSQRVHIRALDATLDFRAGESIWTESSHKFTEDELRAFAGNSGFAHVQTWIDSEWPFAETLWQAAN